MKASISASVDVSISSPVVLIRPAFFVSPSQDFQGYINPTFLIRGLDSSFTQSATSPPIVNNLSFTQAHTHPPVHSQPVSDPGPSSFHPVLIFLHTATMLVPHADVIDSSNDIIAALRKDIDGGAFKYHSYMLGTEVDGQ